MPEAGTRYSLMLDLCVQEIQDWGSNDKNLIYVFGSYKWTVMSSLAYTLCWNLSSAFKNFE